MGGDYADGDETVLESFTTTAGVPYEKVEVDGEEQYRKQGAIPISQQAWAGASAHRLPGTYETADTDGYEIPDSVGDFFAADDDAAYEDDEELLPVVYEEGEQALAPVEEDEQLPDTYEDEDGAATVLPDTYEEDEDALVAADAPETGIVTADEDDEDAIIPMEPAETALEPVEVEAGALDTYDEPEQAVEPVETADQYDAETLRDDLADGAATATSLLEDRLKDNGYDPDEHEYVGDVVLVDEDPADTATARDGGAARDDDGWDGFDRTADADRTDDTTTGADADGRYDPDELEAQLRDGAANAETLQDEYDLDDTADSGLFDSIRDTLGDAADTAADAARDTYDQAQEYVADYMDDDDGGEDAAPDAAANGGMPAFEDLFGDNDPEPVPNGGAPGEDEVIPGGDDYDVDINIHVDDDEFEYAASRIPFGPNYIAEEGTPQYAIDVTGPDAEALLDQHGIELQVTSFDDVLRDADGNPVEDANGNPVGDVYQDEVLLDDNLFDAVDDNQYRAVDPVELEDLMPRNRTLRHPIAGEVDWPDVYTVDVAAFNDNGDAIATEDIRIEGPEPYTTGDYLADLHNSYNELIAPHLPEQDQSLSDTVEDAFQWLDPTTTNRDPADFNDFPAGDADDDDEDDVMADGGRVPVYRPGVGMVHPPR